MGTPPKCDRLSQNVSVLGPSECRTSEAVAPRGSRRLPAPVLAPVFCSFLHFRPKWLLSGLFCSKSRGVGGVRGLPRSIVARRVLSPAPLILGGPRELRGVQNGSKMSLFAGFFLHFSAKMIKTARGRGVRGVFPGLRNACGQIVGPAIAGPR